ncbi:MAG: hypothetical protein HYV63_15420 [Candidatus Schekmanbacteria bacterium]|nr:hypothetical protein [Candidatus Schekmanbacteria bacterium]
MSASEAERRRGLGGGATLPARVARVEPPETPVVSGSNVQTVAPTPNEAPPGSLRSHPLFLTFSDGDLERDFRRQYYQKTVPPLRLVVGATLCFLVVIAVTLWTGMLEWLDPTGALGIDQDLLALSRVYVTAVELPITVGVLLLSFRQGFYRLVQVATTFSAVVILGAPTIGLIVTPLSVPADYAGMIVAVGVFPVVAGLRLRLGWAVLTGVGVSVPYLAALLATGVVGTALFSALTFWILFANVVGGLICRQTEQYARQEFLQARTIEAQRETIRREQERSERLLLNILPESVAARLKAGENRVADGYEMVTVLFADIVDFTVLSQQLTPDAVVKLLNDLFTRFDEVAAAQGVEKIKTVGDAYMAVSGLPSPRADHARAIAETALALQRVAQEVRERTGMPIALRIGAHSGPVVAGVIGSSKLAYDLWGDTVNTASRMESHGCPGELHVTAATYELLRRDYDCIERGVVEVKGKGPMRTYLVRGRRATGARG